MPDCFSARYPYHSVAMATTKEVANVGKGTFTWAWMSVTAQSCKTTAGISAFLVVFLNHFFFKVTHTLFKTSLKLNKLFVVVVVTYIDVAVFFDGY